MIAPENTVGDGSREAERSTTPSPTNSEEAKPIPGSAGLANGAAAAAGLCNVENDQAYDRLLDRLLRERKPAGPIEELLVARFTLCWLRLERAKVLEKLIRTTTAPPVVSVMSETLRLALACDAISLALPKEQPVTQEALEAALRTPGLAELVGKSPDTRPSLSVPDLDMLRRFQQYEAGLEAAFFRALRELNRVQEARLRTLDDCRAVQAARKRLL